MTGDDPLAAQILRHLAERGIHGTVGLAVSGGGDSMALMHLAAQAGVGARVATVDHRLRPEAADEAAMVARTAAALGYAHDTLIWRGDLARGNLPDAARRGRRAALADWARQHGLAAVLLAHTADDVAETFLMRLARGAGVDGLSAMAPTFQAGGVTFLRPLMDASRGDLRGWLAARGLTWAEDPTNSDPAYDRTRARAALAALAPLGLGAGRLAEVAGHLAEARAALEAATADLLAQVAEVRGEGLALRIDRAGLMAAPEELRRRAVVAMIQWLAPADYAPRAAQVAGLMGRLALGQAAQLQGARFLTWKGALWAVPDGPGDLARWSVAPDPGGLTLAPMGAAGLAACPEWRCTGLPRAALIHAPALWQDGALVAAPLAGRPAGFRVWRDDAQTVFAPRVLSH